MAFNLPKAEFQISAQDNTQKAFRRVRSGLSDLSHNAQRSARIIGGVTAAATAAGGAVAYFADRSLDTTQQLANLSKQTGFTTQRIQELRFAGEALGVQAETVDDALAELSQRMGEAAKDGGEMAEGFKQAGIEVDGLLKRKPASVFRELTEAITSAKSESEAAAIATKTLGEEAGRRMLPVLLEGTTRLNSLAQEARNLGLVLDEDTVAGANRAAQELDKLKQVVTLQVSKAFAELAPQITEFTSQLAENPQMVRGFAEDVQTLAQAAINAGKGFAFLAENVEGGLRAIGVVETDEFSKLTNEMDKLRSVQRGFLEDLKDAPKEGSFASIFFASESDLKADINAINEELVRLQEQRQKLLEGEAGGGVDAPVLQELDNAGEKAESAAEGVEAFTGSVKKAKGPLKQAFADTKAYREELERVLEATDPALQAQRALTKQTNILATAFAEGDISIERYEKALAGAAGVSYEAKEGAEEATQATRDLGQQQSQVAQIYEDTATSIRDSFRDTFRDVFDEGVDGFKGFADRMEDVFKDMLADMATMAIARPVIVPVTTAVGGAMGVPGSAQAGVAQQLGGSAFSPGFGGSTALSYGNQALTFAGGSASTGQASMLASQTSGFGSFGTQATQGALGPGSGAGIGPYGATAGGLLLAGGAGYFGGRALYGSRSGGYGAAAGATLGMAVGGPVGAAVGGLAGGAIGDDLFGSDSDPRGTLGQSGATGVLRTGQTGTYQVDKGFGRGDEVTTPFAERLGFIGAASNDLSDVNRDKINQYLNALKSIDEGLSQFLDDSEVGRVSQELKEWRAESGSGPGGFAGQGVERLRTIVDTVDSQYTRLLDSTESYGNDLKAAAADAEQALKLRSLIESGRGFADLLSRQIVGEGVGDFLGDTRMVDQAAIQIVEQYNRENETLVQTYQRLSNATEQIALAAKQAGGELQVAGGELVKFAGDVAEELGGNQALNRGLNTFFGEFFSEQERLEFQQRQARQTLQDRLGDISGVSGRGGIRDALTTALETGGNPERTANLIRAAEATAQLSQIEDQLAQVRQDGTEEARQAERAAVDQEHVQQLIRDAQRSAAAERLAQLEDEQDRVARLRDEWRSLGTRLGRARQDLLTDDKLSPLTPTEQLTEAERQFNQVRQRARLGDQEAMQRLPDVARDFLESSRAVHASSEAFSKDFSAVQQALESSESVAERQARLQSDQLAQLKRQTDLAEQTLAELGASGGGGGDQDYGANARLNRQLAAVTGYGGDFGGGRFNAFLRGADLSADQQAAVKDLEREHLGKVVGAARGFASGLPHVPYDEYPARLHEGEAVIDARTLQGMRRYGIPAGGDRGLVRELQRLRAEVASLRQDQAQHHGEAQAQRAAAAEHQAQAVEQAAERQATDVATTGVA
jgi:hypothetical protein